MKTDEIKKLADDFFEWPTDQKNLVTLTSAIIFVEYCLEKEAGENDKSAKH